MRVRGEKLTEAKYNIQQPLSGAEAHGNGPRLIIQQ